MAITSSAGDGIRITSSAKNGTLGSQAGAANNQIILDTAWATNNGNVNTAALIGRLIILRRGTATEETKKIIVATAASTTVTVHEPWTNAPQSGDTYHISYNLTDCTAFTGCTLSAKTGVYEFTRRLIVGSVGGGTFAYFGITDQEAMETYDNATTPSLLAEINGRFDIGYTFGGVPVGGGIIHCLQNTTAETAIQFGSGSYAKIYDATIVAFRALLNWYNFGPTTTDRTGSYVDLRNSKVINHGTQVEFNATGVYRDLTWVTSLTTGSVRGIWVSPVSTVDNWTLAGPYFTTSGTVGLTGGETITQTITLRNVTWVGPIFWNIVVAQSRSWNVVNPVWTINTGSHSSIGWAGTGNKGQVFEKFSLDVTTVSASGAPISGSSIYVYEGLTTRNVSNSGSSDSSGSFSDDITTRRFTSASLTLRVTQSGDFALKVYRYGFNSFAGAVTFTEPVESQITLTLDDNLSTFSETTALSAGSSSITPIRHGSGTLNPRPLKVLHYNSGSGVIPSAGQLVSGVLSSATGSVLEVVYGDNIDAYLVLSGWNGINFYENETIGNGSGWSAKTDLSASAAAFYANYSWQYNCANYPLQTVYDYDRAQMARLPTLISSSFLDCIRWGEEEQTHFFYRDGDTYYTPRNINLQQGVWMSNRGAGTIAYMTADSGSIFTPPTTVTFELTGLKEGSEVRIYNANTDAEVTGIESTVGTTFSYTYVYSGTPIDIYIVIFHLNWKDIRLTGLELANLDQSIPIQQQTDRVYSNPT